MKIILVIAGLSNFGSAIIAIMEGQTPYAFGLFGGGCAFLAMALR